MKPMHLFAVAGLLLVLAVGLFVMPTPGEPEFECAPEGSPSSGFTDGDCNITIESYEEHRQWATKPKWDNIAGLALLAGSLATAGAGIVLARRGRSSSDVGAPSGAA